MSQSPDPPFAVWRVFQDAPRWWFARGCPPPLQDERRWVRLLRMGVLLGALGFATGVIAAVFVHVTEIWGPVSAIMVCSGFGGMVLVPLSRWEGRAWWLSLLAMPMIGGTFVCLAAFEFWWRTLFEAWAWGWAWAASINFVLFGLVVGLWMTPHWRRVSLPPLIVGMLLSGLPVWFIYPGLQTSNWIGQSLGPIIGWQMAGLLQNMHQSGFSAAMLAIAAGLPFAWSGEGSASVSDSHETPA